MRLRTLAISDTHLGEETSLLSFPRGLQHLWSTLRENPAFWEPVFPGFKEGDRVAVDELILVGDVADRTLSSTSQISAHSHAFALMLADALDIREVIYVPGNHDHTLWTSYREVSRSRTGDSPVTGPEGEKLVGGGQILDQGAQELLSVFLGYPKGWAWWTIDRGKRPDFVFKIANPLYATRAEERTYVFAHGTHFRREVVSDWQRGFLRLFDVSGLDRLLKLELKPSEDLDGAESIEELERRVAPFVDSLWPNSNNSPTSRSDELWYLLTLLREGSRQGWETPEGSGAFAWRTLSGPQGDRFERLTDDEGEPTDGSLERFRKHFLPHLKSHLSQGEDVLRDDLTFVYGDTHRGGWGKLASEDWGKPVRVYNCGSWVVDGPRQHPACHLFAVREDGEEYLLDVAFGEEVKVGEDRLLGLAARDAEHRLEVVNRDVRTLGATLQILEGSLGKGWRFLKNLY